MRIIRLKLDKKVKAFLKLKTRQYGVDDPGFVEDMFALIRLKGNGLPSKERIARMSKNIAKRRASMTETGMSLLISKRKLIFMKLTSVPYFHALASLPDPIAATERLLTRYKRLYNKIRQSQCMTCMYRVDCDFGKQYGETISDITKVIDPDYKKKVHAQCPSMPEVDFLNQFAAAASSMVQMMQSAGQPEQNVVANQSYASAGQQVANPAAVTAQAPDVAGFAPDEDNSTSVVDPEDDGAEFHIPGTTGKPSGVYDGRNDGNALCKVTENFIDAVTAQQLALFELGKKFTKLLAETKAGKFKPSVKIEDNHSSMDIEKPSDLTHINASQHGLPDEVFNARLEKKTLRKKQFLKPEDEKKKLLHLLIDNSASMTSFIGQSTAALFQSASSKFGAYTRGALASVFSLAVTRRVRADKGMTFARFFTGNVSPMVCAKEDADYDYLLDWLSLASYKSGSTNIPAVVKTAIDDIAKAKGEIADAEILLITDCEDVFDGSELKKQLGRIELNILDVSGGDVNSPTSQELKTIATRYYKADERVTDLSKIVALL